MIKLITILIPLREAFGIYIKGIPFRVGELVIPLMVLFFLIKRKNYKYEYSFKFNNKYINALLIILFLNCILTIVVGLCNVDKLDKTFFYKYIVRNILYLTFIFLFYKNISDLKNNMDFEKYIIYIIYIEMFFYILEFFNIYITFSKIVPYTTNNSRIFGSIIRFCGTASEPGFLAPILIIPIYYFYIKKDRKTRDMIYYIISWILAILTFSTFLYVCIFIILMKENIIIKSKIKVKTILIAIFVIAMVIAIIFIKRLNSDFETKFNQIIQRTTDKIEIFIFDKSDKKDFSASSRKLCHKYAQNMYRSYGISEKIFGRGTGAYSYSVKYNREFGKLMEIAEEAASLYYSTITDRGIIGFILLITELYCILKLKVNTIESKTTCASIFTQMIQYYIVGNGWLYFIWLQVALLIYFNYEYNKKKYLEKQNEQ